MLCVEWWLYHDFASCLDPCIPASTTAQFLPRPFPRQRVCSLRENVTILVLIVALSSLLLVSSITKLRVWRWEGPTGAGGRRMVGGGVNGHDTFSALKWFEEVRGGWQISLCCHHKLGLSLKLQQKKRRRSNRLAGCTLTTGNSLCVSLYLVSSMTSLAASRRELCRRQPLARSTAQVTILATSWQHRNLQCVCVSCVEFIPLQLPTTVSFKCVLIS